MHMYKQYFKWYKNKQRKWKKQTNKYIHNRQTCTSLMCENGKKKKNTTFDIYAYINNIFNGLILKTN